MKKYIGVLSIVIFIAFVSSARNYTLISPDGKLKAVIVFARDFSYSLSYDNVPYLACSAMGLSVDGSLLSAKENDFHITTRSVNRIVKPLYGVSTGYVEYFNELLIDSRRGFFLQFRAYNEGFAYRFITNIKHTIIVDHEEAVFHFNDDYSAYFHPAISESDYRLQLLSEVKEPDYTTLPLLVKTDDGMNIVIHESGVRDYPCMALSHGEGSKRLKGTFAKAPSKIAIGTNLNAYDEVKEREAYIAKTNGARNFPWRIISFTKDDKHLLDNPIVYLLADETKIPDLSWIKPGKVTWDWWNANNLSGVDFRSGVNTRTYKYFIDFAAANGIDYINIDDGWSDPRDLLKPTDQVDIPAIMRYAGEKKVGVILWCVWSTIERQMTEALDQFSKWGVSGIKVDFMNRDDQSMVNFYETLLREAAKRKLLVNYHAAFHPVGLERTFPNQINCEGVKGLEWNKFDSAGVSPETDVTIPFIRMFAGSMDYTPGAMKNYNRSDWKAIFDRPMSQGTRCHQLAMYTVYYAPLQMLADSPTEYQSEPAYLKYLAKIPTTWDQTIPLSSKVGDWVTIARRKGSDWFVAAMTDWTGRDYNITLDFLEDGKSYTAEIFMDGPNSERIGSDYTVKSITVKKGDIVNIIMAPGGGWSGRFTVQN